jgi:hypothetical protein
MCPNTLSQIEECSGHLVCMKPSLIRQVRLPTLHTIELQDNRSSAGFDNQKRQKTPGKQ